MSPSSPLLPLISPLVRRALRSSLGPSPVHLALLALSAAGCGSDWKSEDIDGDGFTVEDGDCFESKEAIEGGNLTGASIFPGAEDLPYDGIDANCGNDDDFDLDGDGWVELEAHLGLSTIGVDGSGDHVGFGDCQNTPGVEQAAINGFDAIANEQIHPEADDLWYDGIDSNCDGADDFDQDGDGEGAVEVLDLDGAAGTDCDDIDSSIYSGADEVCDGIDNDCDALLDVDDPDLDPDAYATYYSDVDLDGYGDPATAVASCDPIVGGVLLDGDCDDADLAVNPGAAEVCDGLDNDCDALVDDLDDTLDVATATDWFADADGDTFGDALTLTRACAAPDGVAQVLNPDDCDDTLAGVNPAASEVCDAADNDCDGDIDDADASLDLTTRTAFYADADLDSFGDPSTALQACAAPAGTVTDSSDCDDTLVAVNPSATEVCNGGVDDDCDGAADDADASLDLTTQSTWYQDNDLDSFGSAVSAQSCAAPAGYIATPGDCDDARAAVNPLATEVCNLLDDDCDGQTDDDDSSVAYAPGDRWYADADADTYGNAALPTDACVQPAGTVSNDDDCNDAAAAIKPGASEVCDSGVDNDCDGFADDADASLVLSTRGFWYADTDTDGYGAGAVARACAAPAGRVSNNTDCNDGAAAINPGATEICDGGIDNNCANGPDDADFTVDLSTGIDTYVDADGDTYGLSGGAATRFCVAPAGRSANDSDCDDTRAAVNPAADEVCDDGLDNDCDDSLGLTAGGGSCELLEGAVRPAAQLTWNGADSDISGATLTLASDLSGDDNADLVVSSPEYPSTGATGSRYKGLVSIVVGSDSWTTATDTTANLADVALRRYEGGNANDRMGYATAAGDFTGDGVVDLILGAPGLGSAVSAPADRGGVYLIAGPITAGGGITALTGIPRREGTAASQYMGGSLAANGDVNGDAFADLAIGAPECASAVIGMGSTASTTGGRVLVLRGSAASFAGLVDTATYTGSEANACAGSAVLWADLDGDGVDELLIGEQNRDNGATADVGRVYLADGAATGAVLLSDLPYLRGVEAADRLGQYLGAGDIDGDGVEDLLLGEAKDGSDQGAVHLVSGADFPATNSTPEAVASTTIRGALAGDFFGTAVVVAGDIDGSPDGLPELWLGAQRANAGLAGEGAGYLLYGGLMGLGAVTVDTLPGVRLNGGTASAYLGTAAAGGEDMNADGVPDVVISEARGSANTAGSTHLLLGTGY
ncbi:MAG: FG-GAP repeat protein [Deltaproteobacteria bacterium]|nr:FG-GAP repeat protein [Deltaproteobacteria bacterium]